MCIRDSCFFARILLDNTRQLMANIKVQSSKSQVQKPSMTAYIGLGSNVGDRAGNLLLGIRGILDAGLEVTRLSNIYESEPVETFAQPYFLNMVAELSGDKLPEPEQLLARMLRVELSLIHISEPTRLLSISYAVF